MHKSVELASTQNKSLQDTVLEQTKKIQEFEYQLKEKTEQVEKLESVRDLESQKLIKYTDQLKQSYEFELSNMLAQYNQKLELYETVLKKKTMSFSVLQEELGQEKAAKSSM